MIWQHHRMIESWKSPRPIVSSFLLGLAVLSAVGMPVRADDAQGPGVAATAPAEGRSVEVEGGYMVPYRQTIPGTEISFEMVPIPGGRFHLGSPDSEAGRCPNEGPQAEVDVAPFWMGRCEVTWAEYKEYLALREAFAKFASRGIRPVTSTNQVDAVTAASEIYDTSFTFDSGDDPRQPAVSMTQYAAKQYTKWLSLLTGQFYRLPTEAEWEYACRAGNQSAYNFGDDPNQLDQYAWFCENSDCETHPVGMKKPNAWGLYDMHGNASEWVLDQYMANWYSALQGEIYTAEQIVCWPKALNPRVLRGGSKDMCDCECRSASRRVSCDEWMGYDPRVPQSPWWLASDESLDVGFRIVRPYQPVVKKERAKYWDADLEKLKKDVEKCVQGTDRGQHGIVDPKLPEAIRQLN